MSNQKTIWPVSNTKAENAMFTISVDEDRQLFRAGESIRGFVYINFNDTGEELNLNSLKISLRQSISQPHLVASNKKNVITNVITEQMLIVKDHYEIFSTFHQQLNESLPLKVPFLIELPPPLASSFNSTDFTICYELKAELIQLTLCGELCDLVVTLPIEVNEEPNIVKEPRAQLQEAINDHLMTFYASLKKSVFSTGESVAIEFYVDLNGSMIVLMNFQIQQVLCFADKRVETVIIKEFIGEFTSDLDTGILLSKYSFLLDDTIFTSQPSVHNIHHIKVKYLVSVLAQFNGQSYELFIPIVIERNDDGLYKRYLRVYSDQGLPLLPLTVTVKDLKADGLQSYIPMKQCYENKRLIVKKGQVGGMKAILTIISESFKSYTSGDVIKGFVYLSFPDINEKIVFDKLLIIFVGVCQYKNTGTIHRNGEMFLFKSKILHGDNGMKSSPVVLKGPSSGVVVEFEFDLSKEKKQLPPSFNSDDVMISYELKADVFNLQLNGKKASLYTRLPIIVHDNGKIPKAISQFSKKLYHVGLTLDKRAYKHKDNMDLTINVENKTKKQMTFQILLVQQSENSKTGKVLRYVEVSKPILLLVLPKSKIASNETIPLKEDIFHFQPSLSHCQMVTVGYFLVVKVVNEKHEILNKHDIPVHIKRKYGFNSSALSSEGYPLLPLTLEYFSKDGDFAVPEFLTSYSKASMVKVISSGSCYEKWKGWKIK